MAVFRVQFLLLQAHGKTMLLKIQILALVILLQLLSINPCITFLILLMEQKHQHLLQHQQQQLILQAHGDHLLGHRLRTVNPK